MFVAFLILCYPPVSCLSACHISDSFFCFSSTCLALSLSSSLYVLVRYRCFFVIILSCIMSFVSTPPHMTPHPRDSLPLHRPSNVGIAPDVEEESHVRFSVPCMLIACSCVFALCPRRPTPPINSARSGTPSPIYSPRFPHPHLTTLHLFSRVSSFLLSLETCIHHLRAAFKRFHHLL